MGFLIGAIFLAIFFTHSIFFVENLLSLHLVKMVEHESVVDDLSDHDLDLTSMHSFDSSGSEGDALEGTESLQNDGNGRETHNNHTNDAMPYATTPTTLTSSFLSTLSPSNNNHTNERMEDATTTTLYSSSSLFGPTHAVMSFDNKFAIEPTCKSIIFIIIFV